MSYLNAPEARKRYQEAIDSILSLVNKDTARKLTPLFEEFILTRRSVNYHDKMKSKAKVRRSLAGKDETLIEDVSLAAFT